MPPSKSLTLTEAELRLMDVLWLKGPSTVQQVMDALPRKSQLAYNSVLTTIRILEKKVTCAILKMAAPTFTGRWSNGRKHPAPKFAIWLIASSGTPTKCWC